MTAFVTKDSGERQEFTTGSVRDTRSGKGRYDLLPPAAMRRLAQLYERGAVKYGDRNWEKGQPVMRYVDSALRHLFNFIEGESTEDHLAAAAWNALGAIETLELIAAGRLPAELNDQPKSALHFCHEHPLGGERRLYPCGHYCDDPPCSAVIERPSQATTVEP